MVHHHENVVKSAQHHQLAPGAIPHDVMDEILNHNLAVAKKRNMVSFVNYASDLFQVEVSHLYDPNTLQFTLIVHIPLVSNANLLELSRLARSTQGTQSQWNQDATSGLWIT